MSDDSEVQNLKEEIQELRKTVLDLTETVASLTAHLRPSNNEETHTPQAGEYAIFSGDRSCVERDASWDRLVVMLNKSNQGLTASELASKWGKSRSRTSEVLNKLAQEGHVVKYRDGRKIKFRTLDED